MRVLAALLFAIGLALPAAAAELVMFESRACPWCRAWHQQIGPIYPKTEESKTAPLRRVDIHGPRPGDLRHIDGVHFTPTFVLLDDQRQEIGRIIGYPGEDFFWGFLERLLEQLEAKEYKADAPVVGSSDAASPAPQPSRD